MFSWLKNFFGITDKKEVLVNPVVVLENKDEIVNTIVIETEVKYLNTPDPVAVIDINPTTEKPKKKKAPTKKVDAVDFDALNKTQLLAEAKNRGVKANASLKREEILERLKNAN